MYKAAARCACATFKPRLATLTISLVIASFALALSGPSVLGQSGPEGQALPPRLKVDAGARWEGQGILVKPVAKLDVSLSILAATHAERGKLEARAMARAMQCEFDGEQVEVVLEPAQKGRADTIAEQSVLALGGQVTGQSKSLMRVKLPLVRLEEAAQQIGGVAFIRPPLRPAEYAVESEAIALTGADAWHTAGFDGAGVNVAVIDGGFTNLTAAVLHGDVPPSYIGHDETGGGLEAGGEHGTAVTEAVCDLAPSAQLYLIRIADGVDFENAKDYCIAQGVDIVNHSMGWTGASDFDGTGIICDIASDAHAHGIFWVNAAGNEALKHCQSTFTASTYTLDYSPLRSGAVDKPLTNFPETAFGPALYVSYRDVGTHLSCFLTWDAWSESGQDYDLFLYRSGVGWTVGSVQDQTAGASPVERISYTVPANGWYAFGVTKYSASRDHRLNLFVDSNDSYVQIDDAPNRIAAGSCTDPAVSPNVFAVGAIDEDNWLTGGQEDFSSQGPTNGGLTKPDIAGPDDCLSYIWDTWAGTSQASPFVAGAAALLKCACQTYTNTDIRAALEARVIDMGDPGKDNIYGWGRLNLGVPPLTEVWVDFAYSGAELGTETHPFNTLAEGIAAVLEGGTIYVKAGSTSETAEISKEVTIEAVGGDVTIGAAP